MTHPRGSLPELDLARVRRYVEARVPSSVAAQVRMEGVVRGTVVTIVECRPPGRADLGPSGRVSRSPSSATTRRVPRRRPIGATATSAATHTIGSALRPTPTHCLPRSTQIRPPPSGVDGRYHTLDQRSRRARGGLWRWADRGLIPSPELDAVPTSAVHRNSALARRGAAGRRTGASSEPSRDAVPEERMFHKSWNIRFHGTAPVAALPSRGSIEAK